MGQIPLKAKLQECKYWVSLFHSKGANILFVAWKHQRLLGLGAICGLLGFCAPNDSHSQYIEWPILGFPLAVTNTFNFPTSMTHAGDGSQRLFVVEQPGLVWIIQTNTVLNQPFLDISDRVLNTGAEQGLLGLAFPSGYSTNGR
jgi:hypothetical protein